MVFTFYKGPEARWSPYLAWILEGGSVIHSQVPSRSTHGPWLQIRRIWFEISDSDLCGI